jgi:hypothetical protein
MIQEADRSRPPAPERAQLLNFLRRSVYPTSMNRHQAGQGRPDIAAATRGGDVSIGMDDEPDPATASLELALFWRGIYTEILTMEEAVLERIRQLMAAQSRQARREVELTNVPVVVAQADRFRMRLGFWEASVRAHQEPAPSSHTTVAAVVATPSAD